MKTASNPNQLLTLLHKATYTVFLAVLLWSCKTTTMTISVYETNSEGKKFQQIQTKNTESSSILLSVNPDVTYQTITGFGGSFTESTAYVLSKLSKANQDKVIEAYFGDSGAKYSLCRTHIASCDFSLSHYTYAAVENDVELKHFSIEHDKKLLIPLIHKAQNTSSEGFRLISSPWTAPPWMKDNNHWVGGKLLPKHYSTFAEYLSKYIAAYQQENIDIWGITVINEPHGNGNNWESTHFSPKEMTDLVTEYIGPTFEKNNQSDVKILGYDQNRAELKNWVNEMYRDADSRKYFSGTAIHWYESTYDVFSSQLEYAHHKSPDKYLIQTEACVDAEVPQWENDAWYWQKHATDWGWDWAKEEEKYLHPKYAPVHRYANDIIGCLNHYVDGWIDWNMVLDRQGGPNWFKNWCIAPVIVDTENDAVYFTPLYDIMKHFSKYIRPNAKRIDCKIQHTELAATAAENKDGTIVIVLFNPTDNSENISLQIQNKTTTLTISKQAIQTIVIRP